MKCNIFNGLKRKTKTVNINLSKFKQKKLKKV